MTLIAGIVSRDNCRPLPRSVCDAVRRSISRNSNDNVKIVANDRSFLAKLDIGAFDERGQWADKKGVTLVAGEPLIGDNGRARDTKVIHQTLLQNDVRALREANGVFAAVQFRPGSGELLLVTDKLGIRPLYYYASDEVVIFASALRVLEQIAEVPKVMNVRAITEMAGLGFALADRTPYIDIKLVRPGEIVRISKHSITRNEYWRWDETEILDRPEDDLLQELYRRFINAVARPHGEDRTTAAYLSGGLDSRCIVSALLSRGAAVHTFNFARPGTQDQVFGREFAAAAGTHHHEIPKEAGDLVPDYSGLMAEAWTNEMNTVDRPNVVWSGEGGSVALGHVHLTEQMVSWIRSGDIDAAINEYLSREFAQVSQRLFRKKIVPRMETIISEGIREELERLNCTDPARNFYLFLLLNDQHRKLAKHFEDIDLHRLEFQLPFFDAALMDLIVSIPIDICLRHKLYVKWLSMFPQAVSSVPWQTYPGHQACPVPVDGSFDYQWSKAYQSAERSARRTRVLTQARELLRSEFFPGELLDRKNLRIAAWAHATGLRDYSYLIGPAHSYQVYAEKCSGRYEL